MKQKLFRISGLSLILVILISGCIQQKPSEKYCEQDTDCVCGVHINTEDCFYGNKNYVNTKQQCPDFCTGITGTLRIECIDNECTQVST